MTRSWRTVAWGAAGYIVLWLGCWLAILLPGVPYNVRELFAKGGPLLATASFPVALFLMFAPPALMARRLVRGGWRESAAYAGWVLLHASILWVAVRTVVPLEAIWDVVGSPVLHGPGDWELYGRFLGLAGGISVLLGGGAMVVAFARDEGEAGGGLDRAAGRRRAGAETGLLRWLAPAIPLLLIAHTVVVTWAATDNLTELMAGGGGLAASVWLGLWIVTLGAGGSGLAHAVTGTRRRWAGAALAAASLPAGYFALSLGTVHALHKYGAVFSAMQFLLSPDREHYLGGRAILIRYGVAHAAGIAAVGLTQLPLWAGAHRGSEPRGTPGGRAVARG